MADYTQTPNPQTGLYEYPYTTPKGETIIIPSHEVRTREEVLKKGDELSSQPLPDPNQPMAGVDAGSPTINAAKFGINTAVPAIAATLAPEIAGGSLLNRAAAASLGGVAGRSMVTPLTEGRLATSPELIAEALTAGTGEGIASALIRGPSEAERIGAGFRGLAGTPDIPYKPGEVSSALSQLADVPGASRSILGKDILTALPKLSEPINAKTAALYNDVARTADVEGVRMTIPSKAKEAAALISEDLGDPMNHPNPDQIIRLKKTLDRIANWGEDKRTVQTVIIKDQRPVIANPFMKTQPTGGRAPVTSPQQSYTASLSGRPPSSPASSSVGTSSLPMVGEQRSVTEALGQRQSTLGPPKEPTQAEFLRGQQSKMDLGGGRRPEPTMSVREYSRLYQEIRDLGPEYKDRLMPGDYEQGVMKGLGDAMSEHLDQSLKGTKAELKLVEAKNYYKNTKVPFRDNLANVLAPADKANRYTDVMDLIVRPDKPEYVREAMKHFDPQLKQDLRQSWVNHNIIQKATDPQTGLFDPLVAQQEMNKLSLETRNALFEGKGKDLDTLLEMMAHYKRQHTGFRAGAALAGKIMIPLSVGMYKFATGNFAEAIPALAAGGASIAIFSYIISNPKMLRWAARGLESPQGSMLARRYGQMIIHAIPGALLQMVAAPEPGAVPQFPSDPAAGLKQAQQSTTSP